MKRFSLLAFAATLLLTLTSCEAVGTVFEAGKWWGILIAALVIGLFLFFFRGRGR